MASLGEVFSEQEMTNWLKVWLAINITKTGLHDFVDREVHNFQTSIIQSVASNLRHPANTTCTCCLTANLLKCPTNKVCNKSKHNPVCKMHDTVSKQPRPCPNGICDAFREEIIKAHRYSGPSWNNTYAEKWASNHWEVAKCYMPPDGYIAVNSFEETDFNGVISIILNCNIFDRMLSFSIAPQHPSPSCLLTKARDIGKAARHSSDCKVTSHDLQDYLLTLITFLIDSKVLVNDRIAQDAARKLIQLQTESLNISVADVGQLLNDARETLHKAKQVSGESKTELENYVQQCLTKLDNKVLKLKEESEKVFKEQKQTYADDCKRKLSKLIKNSVQKTHQSMNENDVERDIEEFRRRLVQYYIKNMAHISVSPLLPSHVKSLMEIYASPKIVRIQEEQDGTRKKTEQLYTYKEFFHSVEATGKYIFLQGEPGIGKSSFATKLVFDWCKYTCNTAPQNTEENCTFNDTESLREFKFVFHIALRESRKERKVVKMIKKQIIESLYDDDDDVRNVYKLLLTIMAKEPCLVVEDGLDEWSDPDGKRPFPVLAAPCMVVITTRPWKMSDELLKTSHVDCLLEIEGIIDPFLLSKSVLKCIIDEKLDIDIEFQKFKVYIYEKKLTDFLATPLLLTLIVCLWVDKIFLTGSVCEIYSLLLDCLFKKTNTDIAYFPNSPFTCFNNTKYLKLNIGYIESLSKAAFHLLFTVGKEHQLVFNDKELSKYLTELEKGCALRTGILTNRKLSTLSYRPSTCSFINKSVQEFLAAFHIASNVELIDSYLLKQFSEIPLEWLGIGQVFKFVCGLSITAANRLSHALHIYASTKDCSLVKYNRRSLQDLVITGYKEAKANNFPDEDIHLRLDNFYFDAEPYTETLKCIILINMTNVQSVVFESMSFSELFQTILTSCSSCKTLSPNTLSDRHLKQEITLGCTCKGVHFSAFHSLTHIVIDTPVTLLPNALVGLPNLEKIRIGCKCDGLDLSACKRLRNIKGTYLAVESGEYLELEPNEYLTVLPDAVNSLHELEKLTLYCRCNSLDLSACNNLRKIVLCTRVKLLPNAIRGLPRLETIRLQCICDGIDLSGCNSLRTIELGQYLTLLPDGVSCLHKLEEITLHCRCNGLDLSSCNNLRNVVLGERVKLLPNAIRGLPRLETIRLRCICDGLDLSACNSLRNIELGENVTLLPSALRDLHRLDTIKLRCICDGLDLSACNIIKNIELGKHVTLLPNAIRGLSYLESINLECTCNGLGMSACNSLRKIELGKHVTLLPHQLCSLPKLAEINLKCTYDGLDLSACNSLKNIVLSENVTLLPKALCGLPNLENIDLHCKCDGLDLSACNSLKTIVLGHNVTLLPKALCGLPNLEKIDLNCKCDGLDLSACNSLKYISLSEHVILLPNALRGLHLLEQITVQCICDGWYPSKCVCLGNIVDGENVILLQEDLYVLQERGQMIKIGSMPMGLGLHTKWFNFSKNWVDYDPVEMD
ncbi:uncharacterized protein LOC127839297 [Dreissena polymorpha]|uniref:NACHT domain-containing protein n=1 Tax=Dreissena polymorpha TaxID=45954 RepID=A0A9D4FK09_DREPO|nr:uncharacterized protein LOC127839297 [Dreissena polymorpha]KAH3798101.1 hypothetical protein DPMN_151691 [Dreissena polymorpha]